MEVRIDRNHYTGYLNGAADGLNQGRKDTIAELEKIKEEIEEIDLLRDNPYNNETEYSVSTKELRELFGKHISELKGENNG